MDTKEPVWLSTLDIRLKYEGLCAEKGFSRRLIVKLYRAHLLRGYYDPHHKRFMILEESWLEMVKHVNYNLYLQIFPLDGEPIRFSVPTYCNSLTQIRYDLEKNWYTPTELLAEYEKLRDDKVFDIFFIKQLMHCGLIRGGYDPKEKVTTILLASFIELLLYRDYILRQNMVSPRVA